MSRRTVVLIALACCSLLLPTTASRAKQPGQPPQGYHRVLTFAPKLDTASYLPVVTTSWSVDGRYVAAGYYDGSARIWDATTGALVRTFPQNGLLVQWSPDGSKLALTNPRGFTEGKVTTYGLDIFNASDGQLRRRIPGSFSAFGWSPDGRYMAADLQIVDVDTGVVVNSMTDVLGLGYFNSLRWSPDGRSLAVPLEYSDGPVQTVAVWDTTTGKLRYTITADGNIDWTADSTQVVSIVGAVLTWRDALSGLPIRFIELDANYGANLKLSPDNQHVAVGSAVTVVVDPTNNTLLARMPSGYSNLPYGWANHFPGLDWTRDGKRLLTTKGSEINIWEADAQALSVPLTATAFNNGAPGAAESGTTLMPPGPPSSMTAQVSSATLIPLSFHDNFGPLYPYPRSDESTTWSSQGHYLFTSGDNGDGVKAAFRGTVFDAATGAARLSTPAALTSAWSPDERLLAISADDGNQHTILQMWSVDTGKLLWATGDSVGPALADVPNHTTTGLRLTFSPDSRYIAAQTEQGVISVYTVTGRLLMTHKNNPTYATLWPFEDALPVWEGNTLWVGLSSSRAEQWSFDPTPHRIMTLFNVTGPIVPSHDGKWRAVLTDTAHIFVYDSGSGQFRYLLNCEGDAAGLLGWSQDDRYLFCSSGYQGTTDSFASVWDTQTRQRVARTNPDTYVAMNWTRTSDSTRFLAANFAHDISVWDAATGRMTMFASATKQSSDFVNGSVAMSPDGRLIALIETHNSTFALMLLEAGSGHILLHQHLGGNPDKDDGWTVPVWSPDSKHLYLISTNAAKYGGLLLLTVEAEGPLSF